jgi:hypothetical protein
VHWAGNERSSTIHEIHDNFLTKTCDGTMAEALPPLHSWEAYFTPTNRYRERAELCIAGYNRRLPADIVEIELTGCTLEELLAATGGTWEGLHAFAGPRKIIWTGDDDWMTTVDGVYNGHRSPFKYQLEYSSADSAFHISTNKQHIGDFLVACWRKASSPTSGSLLVRQLRTVLFLFQRKRC